MLRNDLAAPPVWHSIWLLFLYGTLDSHPSFPSHVASGRCFLSAAAAGALAGVVSAFAELNGWCAGAVLDVTWCAVCASMAPSSWRIEVVLVVAGVVTTWQPPHPPPLCVGVKIPMCRRNASAIMLLGRKGRPLSALGGWSTARCQVTAPEITLPVPSRSQSSALLPWD